MWLAGLVQVGPWPVCPSAFTRLMPCHRLLQCLWCNTDKACLDYPVTKILPPSSLCKLSSARWGVCWGKSLFSLASCKTRAVLKILAVLSYCKLPGAGRWGGRRERWRLGTWPAGSGVRPEGRGLGSALQAAPHAPGPRGWRVSTCLSGALSPREVSPRGDPGCFLGGLLSWFVVCVATWNSFL